jgi:hypothetical protein
MLHNVSRRGGVLTRYCTSTQTLNDELRHRRLPGANIVSVDEHERAFHTLGCFDMVDIDPQTTLQSAMPASMVALQHSSRDDGLAAVGPMRKKTVIIQDTRTSRVRFPSIAATTTGGARPTASAASDS